MAGLDAAGGAVGRNSGAGQTVGVAEDTCRPAYIDLARRTGSLTGVGPVHQFIGTRASQTVGGCPLASSAVTSAGRANWQMTAIESANPARADSLAGPALEIILHSSHRGASGADRTRGTGITADWTTGANSIGRVGVLSHTAGG